MLDRIIKLLCENQFRFENEIILQNGIERLLIQERIEHVRELDLGKAGRIDFYFAPIKCGMEIKIKGGVIDVARQLQRYAGVGSIDFLLLVTTKAQHTTLPDTIGGKRVTTIHLCQNGF